MNLHPRDSAVFGDGEEAAKRGTGRETGSRRTRDVPYLVPIGGSRLRCRDARMAGSWPPAKVQSPERGATHQLFIRSLRGTATLPRLSLFVRTVESPDRLRLGRSRGGMALEDTPRRPQAN
jgi:hypothetical protein